MTGPLTRRAHKKSKTGCITCKARRIKCTEERPACARCIKSGRICEGYSADFVRSGGYRYENDYSLSPYHSPPSPLSAYFGGAMSPLELRSLQFFHERTVPALAGFFESNLWQRLLLQISVTEPGLRHAMIAVGFLQKLSDLHGFPTLDFEEGSVMQLDRHDTFALNQYMKAVALVRTRLSTGASDCIITLVACILFVCLEFLRGERKAAFAHLRSGLDIIQCQIQADRSIDSPGSNPNSLVHGLNETDLAPMFARMSLFTTLHRQPRHLAFSGILDLDLQEWHKDESFQSIEQARMVCINQMNMTTRFVWMVITGQFPDDDAIEVGRRDTLERLEAWSQAFEPYLPRTMFQAAAFTAALRGPALLRVHQHMAVMWTKAVRCPQNEWAYDFMLEDFRRITEACNSIIDPANQDLSADGRPPAFSLDYGIIPPLFFVATKCRDPSTRRSAIWLLYRAPRREGVWDAVTAAKVAEVHVSVEEEELLQPSNQDWPPLKARIIDFEMRLRNPKYPGRQLVVLHMVRPDGQGEIELREQYLYFNDVGIQSIPYSDRCMKDVAYRDPISIFESPQVSKQDMGSV